MTGKDRKSTFRLITIQSSPITFVVAYSRNLFPGSVLVFKIRYLRTFCETMPKIRAFQRRDLMVVFRTCKTDKWWRGGSNHVSWPSENAYRISKPEKGARCHPLILIQNFSMIYSQLPIAVKNSKFDLSQVRGGVMYSVTSEVIN